VAPRSEFQLMRLPAEAGREHARLIQCRACGAREPDAAVNRSGDLVIAFSRRPALRRSLGSRVLVVLEEVQEGACGTPCAARSTALLVDLKRIRSREEMKRRVPDIVRAAGEWLETHHLSERQSWDAECARRHAAFWAARRRRDDVIHRTLTEHREQLFQAGLFDLRAERTRTNRDDEHRRTLIEAMNAPLDSSTIRSALVLVPWVPQASCAPWRS
jgi:hypothetical protein